MTATEVGKGSDKRSFGGETFGWDWPWVTRLLQCARVCCAFVRATSHAQDWVFCMMFVKLFIDQVILVRPPRDEQILKFYCLVLHRQKGAVLQFPLNYPLNVVE